MGWWSTTIMGGDTPLDFEAVFYRLLGIEMYPKNSSKQKKIPKAKLEKAQDKIVRKIKSMEKDGWDSEIGFQAMGVVMMEAGAKISDKNKKLILNAAKKDSWAKEDKGRRKHINSFVLALQSYDGTEPVIITSEGLFEAFAKHKGGGLINKNIKKLA
jgi:hypothetical protein